MVESIEKIVLYHGSLGELNARSPIEQYKPATTREFFQIWKDDSRFERDALAKFLSQIKENIFKKGFSGLVNVRTSYSQVHYYSTPSQHYFFMEGTPIVKVEI